MFRHGRKLAVIQASTVRDSMRSALGGFLLTLTYQAVTTPSILCPSIVLQEKTAKNFGWPELLVFGQLRTVVTVKP